MITFEEAVEFAEIRTRAKYQLVEQLSLVFEPPSVLGCHRYTFIKPTRDRLTTGGTPDQDVCDFVPQHVLESVVRIAWGSGGEKNDQIRSVQCESRDPRRNLSPPIRTFRGQQDMNGAAWVCQTHEPLDIGKTLRIE